MEGLAGLIVDIWKFFYRKAPRLTIIATVALTLTSIFLAIYLSNNAQKQARQLADQRAASLSYNQQLEALNNVQGSLNNLIQFVEAQKTKLKESEDLINSLKMEQEKLKPVVEADRKTVDALLELQEKKTEKSISKERWYGFGLGVLSSLVASLVITLVSFLVKRRKRSPPTPVPTTS
jgi:uncharacterized membrane protein YdfJ with MMPL/SSD domain